MTPPSSKILAVDPGTRISGYGLVHLQGSSYVALDYGCIRPPPRFKLSERYLIIFDSIEALIEKYQPDTVVVETQYMDKNAQSALKLGMARAAVMIAAKKSNFLFLDMPLLKPSERS